MAFRGKSYDVLPALSVRRGELRKSLRIATFSWMFGAVWAVMVSGIQLKNYARMLGFGDFQLSLLAAAPLVANFGQLLAAELIERSGLRKFQFLYFALAHRLLWLVIAVIPIFMFVPSGLAVWAMLFVYFASWLMQAMANPAWTTWMGDLVPKRIRGRYFANRFGFGRVMQVIVVVAIGILLDHVTLPMPEGQTETAASQPMLLATISMIFAVAAVLGAIEIWMYRKIREICPQSQDVAPPKRLSIAAVFRDTQFRRYAIYGMTIAFATAVPGFFFWVYTTESLGFSKLAANVMYMVISPILGMIGLKVWGILLDRWGRRPVLLVATFMTVFSIMPYFFTTPHTPWPAFITDVANWAGALVGQWVGRPGWVWITPDMPVGAYLLVGLSCMVGGVGWTGVMMGQNNFVLGFADVQGRSRYVAIANVAGSIGGVIGAFTGGLVVATLDWMQFTTMCVGPFIWNKYHATFAISGIGRILAVLCLVKMQDPGSGHVREMVRHIGLMVYGNMSTWFLYPFRIVRKKAGKDDAEHPKN